MLFPEQRFVAARPPCSPRIFLLLVLAVAAAVACISYLLWPTWPSEPPALNVPALPVTVGGVLFEVPPAAIRTKLQRHAGQHERIDLAFAWPELSPASNDRRLPDNRPIDEENATAALEPKLKTTGCSLQS